MCWNTTFLGRLRVGESPQPRTAGPVSHPPQAAAEPRASACSRSNFMSSQLRFNRRNRANTKQIIPWPRGNPPSQTELLRQSRLKTGSLVRSPLSICRRLCSLPGVRASLCPSLLLWTAQAHGLNGTFGHLPQAVNVGPLMILLLFVCLYSPILPDNLSSPFRCPLSCLVETKKKKSPRLPPLH